MTRDRLTRAWLGLVALSVAGGLLAHGPDHAAVAVAILTVGFLKSRLILHHYLGLARAPAWRRGFDTTLAGFCLALAALALAA
jgi:hypothetical protein